MSVTQQRPGREVIRAYFPGVPEPEDEMFGAILEVVLVTAVLLAVVLLAGCAGAIHPLRPGEVPCRTEVDCPRYYYCGFAGVDTHPTCRWGGPDDGDPTRLP